ncbi:MAG: biotin--[acetyl-CoA-carboxylase] ligase [Deltaproteobacteria bacterium]|nr:MAG: biotin--[acetyl-CoA-carboxylase] ligase [Deltaproteobacteria bacterium]PIE74925.1 MAG: biotin--[acetyl-CoA-carboxylase] ligase [Deltaproteobacteria bacterium]
MQKNKSDKIIHKEKGSFFIPGKENTVFSPPENEYFLNKNSLSGEWIRAGELDFHADIFAAYTCVSTMDALDLIVNSRIQSDIRKYVSFVSETQSGGRGQHKRTWISKKGNLYASVKIPFVFSGEWSENFLPLIMGNLVSGVLKEFGINTDIKWPNDIIYSGRKLGGILVEKKKNYYNVGIGLNLDNSPDDCELESFFSLPAVSLREKNINISNPFTFWNILFEHIFYFFNKRLAKEKPFALINDLTQKLLWLDEEVFVKDYSGKVSKMTLAGLSGDGGLILHNDSGKKVLYSAMIRAVSFQ